MDANIVFYFNVYLLQKLPNACDVISHKKRCHQSLKYAPILVSTRATLEPECNPFSLPSFKLVTPTLVLFPLSSFTVHKIEGRVSNHRKAWEQGSPLTAACANLAILRCFSCSWSMAVLRWSREKLNPEHREERACNAALHPASSSSKPRWDLEGRSTLIGIGVGTHSSLTGQAPAPQHHCHTVQREAAPDGP